MFCGKCGKQLEDVRLYVRGAENQQEWKQEKKLLASAGKQRIQSEY